MGIVHPGFGVVDFQNGIVGVGGELGDQVDFPTAVQEGLAFLGGAPGVVAGAAFDDAAFVGEAVYAALSVVMDVVGFCGDFGFGFFDDVYGDFVGSVDVFVRESVGFFFNQFV